MARSSEPEIDDPLAALLVDAADVDRTLIAGVLSGILAIDAATGRIVMSGGYQRLDARRKIVAALLGRKAAHLLEVVESEALTNKEVGEVTGLPPGTAAPSLKSLRELRLVAQDGGKAYYVPNPQIHAAAQFLSSEGRS